MSVAQAAAAPRDFSKAFALDDPQPSGSGAEKVKEVETNAHKIEQRQKQVDFGKNTLGYESYRTQVPKNQRTKDIERHPKTPNVRQVCSKRSWDGQVKKWRRALHTWDPAVGDDEEHVDQPAAVVKGEGDEAARGSGGGGEPNLKRKAADEEDGARDAASKLRPTTPGSDKKQRIEPKAEEAAAAAGAAGGTGVQEVKAERGTVDAGPSIFDDTNEFEEQLDFSESPLKAKPAVKAPAAGSGFFDLE